MPKAPAVLSTTVLTAAPAAPVAEAVSPAAVAARPHTIRFTEPTHVAFAIAAVHIRNGYRFSADIAPEVYPSQGQSSIVLELGHPDQHAVAAAEATTALAVERQQAEFERQVEAAARQMVEDAARKAKQEQLAAEIAESKKALRALEAAAQAV